MQPLLKWRSNKCYIFWVHVCSFSYPSCSAHAPYCHLWPVRHYCIFSHYLINGTIFEKKKYWTQNVLIFCIILFEISLIPRKIKRDIITNVHTSISVFMYSTGYSCQILTFWRRNYFFNLSTPVYKMWIIQEPNKLELWNKLHFKEKKTESIHHV